jgi:hypothetical protein
VARKTFISYKYSEAQDSRDRILDALGEDATYYQGETADSPDLTDSSTESIKNNLRNMMYDTSVTIVVVSPNITASKWIDWEIEYSLKEISRDGRTSKTNGVVGVVQQVKGKYDWLVSRESKDDGCSVRTIDGSKLYKIINENRYNRARYPFACKTCRTYSQMDASYISLINEDKFLSDPKKYIENAYEKSQNAGEFELTKQR